MTTTKKKHPRAYDEGEELAKIWAKLLTCEACGNRYTRLGEAWSCRQLGHTRLMSDYVLTERIEALGTWDEDKGKRERQIGHLLKKLKEQCGAVLPNFVATELREEYGRQATAAPCALKVQGFFVAYGPHALGLAKLLNTQLHHFENPLSRDFDYCTYAYSGFDFDGKIEAKLRAAGWLILEPSE